MKNAHISPALLEAQAQADAAWVALGHTIYTAALAVDTRWLDEEDASHA